MAISASNGWADARHDSLSSRVVVRHGYTLLEIMIALALVAVLLGASLPYLRDALNKSSGDRAADAIVEEAQKTRSKAMESGVAQYLDLATNKVSCVSLPADWKLMVKGLNDGRFHDPLRTQSWEFSPSGICEPLELRLVNGQQAVTLSFDALTAQLLPSHE